jgi:hypothetical protein
MSYDLKNTVMENDFFGRGIIGKAVALVEIITRPKVQV